MRVLPDSKESKLGSNDQEEASPSAGKILGSFRSMFTHDDGSASLQLFLAVWIFLRSLGVICYADEFSLRITKITSRIGVS